MEEYIKLFDTHAEYIAYINGEGSTLPNVSYCEDNEEVHYNPSEESVRHFISIDSLPYVCCDEETGEHLPYEYDISEEDYIVNYYLPLVRDPDYSDIYEYVGEYIYDSNKYYMWEFIPGMFGMAPMYILTTQKSFLGQTVRDNIQNRNCPIYAGLDYDLEIYREHLDYIDSEKIIFDEWKIPNTEKEFVVTAKFNITDINNPTKLLDEEKNIYYSNKIEIDGIVQSNMINEYLFDTIGEHVVKYTLKNPKVLVHMFEYCHHLTSVIIPNSVTNIGDCAFENCTSLTSVTIPNSVTNIEDAAFAGCSSLTELNIPNSVISIGHSAFRGCTNLISMIIPNSVTYIGYGAFEECSLLTSVTIGNSVTTIDDDAFYDCQNLASINIPDSVTNIGIDAFDGTAWYNSQPNGIIYIGKVAYKYKGTMPSDTNIILKEGTIGIGGGAFSDCSGLTSITIPNSVISIEIGAFASCSGLTSITIPNSVTNIGENAFGNCIGLNSISIPNSVTTIGNYAFEYCSGLTSVNISNSITNLTVSIFYNCTNLTSVIIPDSVTNIESGAFRNCSALTSVTIGNSVTRIGGSVFSGCRSLTSVTIPNSVKYIGEDAFANCSSLTSVTISNSVTSISDEAFRNCNSLNSIICNAITAPKINSDTFQNVKTEGVLTVPVGSTGYDVWMDTDSYYLGYYNWTKVEL